MLGKINVIVYPAITRGTDVNRLALQWPDASRPPGTIHREHCLQTQLVEMRPLLRGKPPQKMWSPENLSATEVLDCAVC